MNNLEVYVVACLLAAAVGVWVGASIVSSSWQRDCLGVGGHVVGDVVYQCSKKEK